MPQAWPAMPRRSDNRAIPAGQAAARALLMYRAMRTATLLFTLACCGTTGREAPARQDAAMNTTPPLELTVTPTGDAMVGRPIAVNVAVFNTSGAPVAVNRRFLLDHDAGPGELALTVTAEGAAQPLVFQSLITPADLRDDNFTTLAPGGHLAVRVDLGSAYALSTAGRYTIVARYRNADTRGWVGDLTSAPARIEVQPGPPPIGHVTMLGDGSLDLQLRHPSHGRRISRDAPEYGGILAHVGPMQPGDQRLVPPWPDAIDDAAVARTVREHVGRTRGWQVDEWTHQIMGTGPDGNISVTVSYRGDPRAPRIDRSKSFPLVVSADGTRVVKELAFP